MRVMKRRVTRGAVSLARRLGAVAALCGVALPGGAAELVQTPAHLWVSAAALSLTLLAAADRPKR